MAQCSEADKPSLLLGNGFSRAWRDDIFSYSSLLDRAEFGEGGDKIRTLFASLGTYDFEAVMRAMESAIAVLDAYGDQAELRAKVATDIEALKEALITAISTTHPSAINEVRAEQFRSARSFLHKFGSIFTLNYDLLFYWARNAAELEPVGVRTDDGFRGKRWMGYGTEQEAHFLHGGLHLYDVGSGVFKHTFSSGGIRIIDLVRRNLDAGRFPLFVSEPTSKKKLERIAHNSYLNFCYRKLLDLNGCVFVLGHSMDENDKHIFDQIKKAPVRQIYVSIHGDPDTEGNARVMANANAFLGGSGRRITFFDAETANVWG